MNFQIPTTQKMSGLRNAKAVKPASYTFQSKGSKAVNEGKYRMPETLNSARRKIITADNEIKQTCFHQLLSRQNQLTFLSLLLLNHMIINLVDY